MASITIRQLDDGIKAKGAPKLNLADSIRRHLDPFGGVELRLRSREAVRRPPRLTK